MIRTLISRFNKSSFYSSVAWVAGGTAVAQAVTILTTPVITRIYTPSDYGVLAVFTAILGVMQPISTLTYATAIPLAEDDRLAHNVLKLCLTIAVVFSLALAGMMLAFGHAFVSVFAVPQAAPYLWLLSLCLLGSGCYDALSSWAVRKKHFRLVSATQLSQGVSSAGVKIALGWLGFRPLGLLLGLLASSAAGCGSILRKLLREEPQVASQFSYSEIRDAAVRFRSFPLFRSWSKLLLGLNVRLPVFFIAAMFDSTVAGLFGLANSMVNLPMVLVGGAVARVYYAEIASFGKSRPNKILTLTLSVIRRMSVPGIIAVSIIMLAGPWMFSAFFGPEWREAGVYARWLSLVIVLRFLSSPVMHCFDVLEMQGVQLFINIARTVLILVVFLVGKLLNLTAVNAIGLYAVGLALFHGAMIMAVLALLRRQVKLMETRT
jgi:O-antigen/teichoic acid export membrane protein